MIILFFFWQFLCQGLGWAQRGRPCPTFRRQQLKYNLDSYSSKIPEVFAMRKTHPSLQHQAGTGQETKYQKPLKKNLKNQGNSAQNGTQIPFSGCWIQGVSWPQPTPKFSKTELKERTKFNILKFPFPGCFLRRGDAWEPEGQIDLESFNTKVFFELLLGQSRSVTTTLGQFKEEVKKSSFGAAFRVEKPQIE